MQHTAPKLSARAAALVAGGWGVAVAAGFVGLAWYSCAPGKMGHVPERWPEATRILRTAGRPTLVMFAQPRCGCTRASLAELNRLASARSFDAIVAFVSPPGTAASFARSDLWRSASAIPRTRVVRDDGGVEAARFGAGTSGAVLLYSSDGKLLFAGGITPARGHRGDSLGRQRILALLDGEAPDRRDAPVFGCALGNESVVPVPKADVSMTRGVR
jgi:hypothetical protein